MKEKNLLQNSQKYMGNKIIESICISHIGKRLNHEDNFLFNNRFLTLDMQKQMQGIQCVSLSDDSMSGVRMFAVSDGMGGHNAGEIASYLCVEKLSEIEIELRECFSVKEAVEKIQSCIKEINDFVCGMSDRNMDLSGMGATLVMFIVCGEEYAVLNIGDSRGYFFNGEFLAQITKDHTEGQRLLDLGLLTRKELADFPAKKNLSRYIGYGKRGFVLQAEEYYPEIGEGILMLCSDGISDFISDKQILNILQTETKLEATGRRMVEDAVTNQNADNATIILIKMGR